MTKSPTAFRTISEVAGELDLPQHVLRFWETKFSQLKPMKRGGRRRYYRPEDITLLRCIRSLLYDDGYTIKGVQKRFRQGSISRGVADTQITAAHKAPTVISASKTNVKSTETQLAVSAAVTELEALREKLRGA